MDKLIKSLYAVLAVLLLSAPAQAQYRYKFKSDVKFEKGVVFGQPFSMPNTFTVNGDTITIQDLGNANLIQSAGAQTIGGVKTFSAQPVFSVPLIKSNLGNQSKRVIYCLPINGGGTLSDSTTYRGWFVPGRAGSVTKISVIAATAPIGGTNTVKVLKGSSSGNTMLSAASYDPTGLTANQAAAMTLTSTSADLALTASGASSGAYIEWATGSQTTDAINCCVQIEFEPDDY